MLNRTMTKPLLAAFLGALLAVMLTAPPSHAESAANEPATAPAQDEPAPPDLSRLIEEYARLKTQWYREWAEFYRNGFPAGTSFAKFGEDVIEQDRLLRRMIEVAFRETANFNLVKQRLEGVVEFREFPKDYGASWEQLVAMHRCDSSEDPTEVPTVVFVSRLEAPGRREFYMMENTHRKGTGLGIVSLAMGSIIDGKATYQRLPFLDWSVGDVTTTYMVPRYVRAMFATSDTTPDVIAIDPSVAPADYTEVCAIVYDDATAQWRTMGVAHLGYALGVDDASHVLHYEGEIENPANPVVPEETLDLAEWLRSCKQRFLARRQERAAEGRL